MAIKIRPYVRIPKLTDDERAFCARIFSRQPDQQIVSLTDVEYHALGFIDGREDIAAGTLSMRFRNRTEVWTRAPRGYPTDGSRELLSLGAGRYYVPSYYMPPDGDGQPARKVGTRPKAERRVTRRQASAALSLARILAPLVNSGKADPIVVEMYEAATRRALHAIRYGSTPRAHSQSH